MMGWNQTLPESSKSRRCAAQTAPLSAVSKCSSLRPRGAGDCLPYYECADQCAPTVAGSGSVRFSFLHEPAKHLFSGRRLQGGNLGSHPLRCNLFLRLELILSCPHRTYTRVSHFTRRY